MVFYLRLKGVLGHHNERLTKLIQLLMLQTWVSCTMFIAEMITIRFPGWISGRRVSLQPDTDIQKLLSNGNRIRIRISETFLSIFRRFRLLEKVAHCTIIRLLSSEASFHPSEP